MRALRGLDPIIKLMFLSQRKINGVRSRKSYSSDKNKPQIVLCGVESHGNKPYNITTERPELSCQQETTL